MTNKNNAIAFPDQLDFYFVIHGDKKNGAGEDSYLLDMEEQSGVVAVFDGCGGSGARQYKEFGGHSGAYISSRVLAEAAGRWFRNSPAKAGTGTKYDAGSLKKELDRALALYKANTVSESGLKSSLIRELPSTLAMLCMSRVQAKNTNAEQESGKIRVQAFWTGDSRCYYLDPSGLYQLTEDDLPVRDAMRNLYENAPMNNVISASAKYEIHEKNFTTGKTGILFAATDGIFGYFPSPMTFERVLLETMGNSSSILEWKDKLIQVLEKAAGDDYTMGIFGFGFGSFSKMQRAFAGRMAGLREICPDQADVSRMTEVWQKYRERYEMFLTGGRQE